MTSSERGGNRSPSPPIERRHESAREVDCGGGGMGRSMDLESPAPLFDPPHHRSRLFKGCALFRERECIGVGSS